MKWVVGWGAVAQCNMNCQFCYSKDVRYEEGKFLGYAEWVEFIDENHEYIDNINYGTGESSLSDDWFKLVSYISRNYPQIEQSLTTNGYISEVLLTNQDYHDDIIRSLKEIDVSLDFHTEALHNQFRGQSKAYHWAISTLEFCQRNNISSTLVFIGTNATLDPENLQGLFEIGRKYGAKLRMNIFKPTRTCKQINENFILSYEKIIEALKWINAEHKILSIDDALFAAILTATEQTQRYRNSLRILHDGSITPSTYLISDNFRHNNITSKNILKHLNHNDMGMEYVQPKECDSCIYNQSCGGGEPERRYLWYGTFGEKDPYCPFRSGNFLPDFNVSIDKKAELSSIHHGYLSTMFFAY